MRSASSVSRRSADGIAVAAANGSAGGRAVEHACCGDGVDAANLLTYRRSPVSASCRR
jgi:hypothetical protein